MNDCQKLPIAVFDSGLGGISVLRELVKFLPHEDFIYFGDSRNAPYGNKLTDEVQRLTMAHTAMLLALPAKAVVIACNTATSVAIHALREQYPEIPIIGLEPALKPAVLFCRKPLVLVMATDVTLREDKFRLLLNQYQFHAQIITVACPGIVPFIERDEIHTPEFADFLDAILQPFQQMQLDAVVLGCTHFPFVKQQIEQALKRKVTFFDGGRGAAQETARRLFENGLLKRRESIGSVQFLNSDPDPQKLILAQKLFMGHT